MSTKKPADAVVASLLFSIDQTCARLGNMSRTKLYDEMSSGDLEYIQIGDRRFTTDEHLQRYIVRKQAKTRRTA
jgi:hypothetical protein